MLIHLCTHTYIYIYIYIHVYMYEGPEANRALLNRQLARRYMAGMSQREQLIFACYVYY